MVQEGRNTPLILVVDDDLSMRMLMEASLRKSGYDVVQAVHGREALELFQKLRPDAILLDVMMPELDGFETCAAIRRLPEGEYAPVLMVTGLDDIDSIHRAFEVGATDFTTKPINWVMLAYRVRYMLRSNQAFVDLHRSQVQLAEAQHLARMGNWELNPETGMLTGSPEFFRVAGLETSGGVSVQDFLKTVPSPDREVLEAGLADALRKGEPYDLEYRIGPKGEEERIVHLRGESFDGGSGHKTWLRGFVQDVTELRKAEEQIRYLAFFDGLTGLANRELFNDRLTKAMAAAKRQDRCMALLFLDLDHFKRINDTLGHHIGDLLLKTIAERLSCCVRESDCVGRFSTESPSICISRLGGDEFTILMTDLVHPQDAVKVAQRIIETLPRPVQLNGHEVHVTTSIGISVFPLDGDDVPTLVKNADAAMYEAKRKGRNNYQFYKESLNAIASKRLNLEMGLRKALERGEFVLHYQPQVDLASGRIEGAEALVRWNSPQWGLVSPADFIPLSEDLGLIVPLTEWIIREASEQSALWRKEGFPPLRISVNISGKHFNQHKLFETSSFLLGGDGFDPRYLDIELTESTLMENSVIAGKLLNKLKERGHGIAIDDFGTGYSSLAYLKTFPIDALKIDRSFVRDIAADPNDAAIVRAIVVMAHSLGMKVIAEGVETEEQLEYLRELGCNTCQGFLFSPPVPAETFAKLLAADREMTVA